MLTEKTIKINPLNKPMTELELIAKELGSLVRYWTNELDGNHTIESLSYENNSVLIIARDDLKHEYGKSIWYYIDVTKLSDYQDLLKLLKDSDLSRRAYDLIKGRKEEKIIPDKIGNKKVGGSLDVLNFNDLSLLITKHSELL